MAELKIRRGSFLIQVKEGNLVVFAARVPDVDIKQLTKVVIQIEQEDEDEEGTNKTKMYTPLPEIEIDIRGKPDNKEQILTWKGVGQGYTGGAPKKKS